MNIFGLGYITLIFKIKTGWNFQIFWRKRATSANYLSLVLNWLAQMHSPSKSAKVCQNLSNSVNFPQMLKNLVKRKLLYSASPSSISARLQQLYNIYQNICILMFRNISNLCSSQTWVLINFCQKGCCCILGGAFPWDLVNKTQMDSSLGSLNSQMGRLEFKKVLFSIFILLGWLINISSEWKICQKSLWSCWVSNMQ